MYCIRLSFVTAISDPPGIKSTERDTPKSATPCTQRVSQSCTRESPECSFRTFFGDGKVQREVFLDVAGVRLELEKTVVEFRIERRKIVEITLPSEPLPSSKPTALVTRSQYA